MDASAFAREWEAGWKSHDLDRVMAHYRDDVVFRSRKAIPLTGSGEVVGAKALRAYWAAALARQPDLRFTVVDVFGGFDMLVITYRNHRNVFAAETLYFDGNGRVYQAAACHRVELD
ncbi:MAG: nuclear transport factor 2 family protein [Pseudomonadota bacterium]